MWWLARALVLKLRTKWRTFFTCSSGEVWRCAYGSVPNSNTVWQTHFSCAFWLNNGCATSTYVSLLFDYLTCTEQGASFCTFYFECSILCFHLHFSSWLAGHLWVLLSISATFFLHLSPFCPSCLSFISLNFFFWRIKYFYKTKCYFLMNMWICMICF